jgi:hypothetical protein
MQDGEMFPYMSLEKLFIFPDLFPSFLRDDAREL